MKKYLNSAKMIDANQSFWKSSTRQMNTIKRNWRKSIGKIKSLKSSKTLKTYVRCVERFSQAARTKKPRVRINMGSIHYQYTNWSTIMYHNGKNNSGTERLPFRRWFKATIEQIYIRKWFHSHRKIRIKATIDDPNAQRHRKKRMGLGKYRRKQNFNISGSSEWR